MSILLNTRPKNTRLNLVLPAGGVPQFQGLSHERRTRMPLTLVEPRSGLHLHQRSRLPLLLTLQQQSLHVLPADTLNNLVQSVTESTAMGAFLALLPGIGQATASPASVASSAAVESLKQLADSEGGTRRSYVRARSAGRW